MRCKVRGCLEKLSPGLGKLCPNHRKTREMCEVQNCGKLAIAGRIICKWHLKPNIRCKVHNCPKYGGSVTSGFCNKHFRSRRIGGQIGNQPDYGSVAERYPHVPLRYGYCASTDCSYRKLISSVYCQIHIRIVEQGRKFCTASSCNRLAISRDDLCKWHRQPWTRCLMPECPRDKQGPSKLCMYHEKTLTTSSPLTSVADESVNEHASPYAADSDSDCGSHLADGDLSDGTTSDSLDGLSVDDLRARLFETRRSLDRAKYDYRIVNVKYFQLTVFK